VPSARQRGHCRTDEGRQSAPAFGRDGHAAGGATLDMVGTVLRHRSLDMTAHYAKVDVLMLQQIAQPWPGDA
jgi:hypothetical protein